MPTEGAEQPAAGAVPQFQRVIQAAGEDARAVWRKRHRLDPSRVRDFRDNLDLDGVLGACWRHAKANRQKEGNGDQVRPEKMLHDPSYAIAETNPIPSATGQAQSRPERNDTQRLESLTTTSPLAHASCPSSSGRQAEIVQPIGDPPHEAGRERQ